jgi:hypothetical protein
MNFRSSTIARRPGQSCQRDPRYRRGRDEDRVGRSSLGRASLTLSDRPPNSFAVQAFDGCAAFRIIAHRHECETSWLACFSIGYDLNLCDAPKLFEDMLKVSFSDGERNISNVEFHGMMGL